MNPRPDLCANASVKRFPTWVLKDGRHEGVLTLEQIAQGSGFEPKAAATK